MPDSFDPYHKWLGIPPDEQPPSCYRLLGVQPFENDPDVIEMAADRQMAFLRSLRTNDRMALVQRVLNEVAKARVVLADPRQKALYDESLRNEGFDSDESIEEVEHLDADDVDDVLPASEAPDAFNIDVGEAAPSGLGLSSTSAIATQSRHKSNGLGDDETDESGMPPWMIISGVGGFVLAALLIVLSFFIPQRRDDTSAGDDNAVPELKLGELEPIEASEGQLIEILVSPDNEFWNGNLLYALGDDAPEGASIDASSGHFRWQPGEAFGGQGRLSVTILANGTVGEELRTASVPLLITTIKETNQNPSLTPIEDRVATPGTVVRIPLVAIDADLPRQSLTFELLDGPTGMELDEANSQLVWRAPLDASGLISCSVAVVDPHNARDQSTFQLRAVDTGVMDLLPSAVTGSQWKRDGQAIVSQEWQASTLAIASDVFEDYDIEMQVTRQRGDGHLELHLPVRNHLVGVVLDAHDGSISGLQPYDGKTAMDNETRWRGTVFHTGQPARINCRISADSLEVQVDEKSLVRLRRPNLSRFPSWPHKSRAPIVVTGVGTWRIDAAKVRRIQSASAAHNRPDVLVPAVSHRPSEFLSYLLNQGYYDLALNFLDRADNDVTRSHDADFVEAIGYTKGLICLREAEKLPPNQREHLEREAMHRWINLAMKHPDNEHAPRAAWRSALRLSRLIERDLAAQKSGTDATTLAVSAYNIQDRLKLASSLLTTAEANLEERLKERRPPNISVLREDWLCNQLLQASMLAQHAQLADKDANPPAGVFDEAAARLEAIYQGHQSRIGGWYARAQLARCLRSMGDDQGAEKSLEEVRLMLGSSLDEDQLDLLCRGTGLCSDLEQFHETLLRDVGASGRGGPFDGRAPSARPSLVIRRGGSAASERAVESALQWLAKHQNRDGSWDFVHVSGDNCSGFASPGTKHTRMGATGLAMLPFLAAGHTHRQGEYQQTVNKGLKYLIGNMKVSNNTGRLYDADGEDHSHMYAHAIATTALAEAYGMTRDTRLKVPAQYAINYIVAAQDPKQGGWLYTPRAGSDTSVTGWQMQALQAGKLSRLQIPKTVYPLVSHWLDSVQSEIPFRETIGARYGYKKRDDRVGLSQACSAIGLLTRNYLGVPQKTPGLKQGLEILSRRNVSSKDMYSNYYTTLLMYYMDGPDGAIWKKWNTSMRELLIARQVQDNADAGSWHFDDDHMKKAGRLFSTALATLTLEIYYRYAPLQAAVESKSDDFLLDLGQPRTPPISSPSTSDARAGK